MNLTRIVLQGEFVIVNGKENPSKIKTSSPFNCTVLTLFEPQSKVTALVHFDDYTDVKLTMKKVMVIMKNRFKVSLDSSFEATIFGGIDEQYSIQTQTQVRRSLERHHIKYKKMELEPIDGKHPQIEISSKEGTVTSSSIMDAGLELLQQREYGAWNDFLDVYFPRGEEDPPYYPAKEGKRTSEDVPNLNIAGLSLNERISAGLSLLQSHQTTLKLKAERDLNDMVLPLKQLKKLMKDVPDKMKESFKVKDLNLLLRQTATSRTYLPILKHLLKYCTELEIKLDARGAKSGTALDVAKQFKNVEAERLLLAEMQDL